MPNNPIPGPCDEGSSLNNDAVVMPVPLPLRATRAYGRAAQMTQG
jgi:hypothetical protein